MCFKRHGHLMPVAEREVASDRQAISIVGRDFVNAPLHMRRGAEAARGAPQERVGLCWLSNTASRCHSKT
jgi:hypothetical protein